jgi:ABC-2 type transport system permease protein
MNGFLAFLSKELMQTLRSMRLVIIAAVFLLLGLMNAPLAKFTPLILELAGAGDLAGVLMPEPRALDAWAQFFGNVAQMGILVILLVCGSTLSGEKSKGTLILPLTKGLGRTGVVLIKFLTISSLWTIGMLIAALSSWFYTVLLFPDDTVTNLVLTIFLLWLLGEFLLALVPLSSVLFRGSMSGLIIPGAVLFILLVLSAFPDLFFWNPILLATHGMTLMINAKQPIDFLAPGLCSVIVAVGALVFALLHFRKAAV